ncbi:unnamed protein product, partial [Polarella glacialis]
MLVQTVLGTFLQQFCLGSLCSPSPPRRANELQQSQAACDRRGCSMTEVSYDFGRALPDATTLGSSATRLVAIAEASEREDAIQTVFKLIHGVLATPDDAKKRRVKKANETFHRKVGRHAAALDFLRGCGFVDADDPDAPDGLGAGALLSMPVAYMLRLTDAHHTLFKAASEAGMSPPGLPGSSFNPYTSSLSKMDSTSSAKAPESWKSE